MDRFHVGVVVSYLFLIKKEVTVPSSGGSLDNNYFFSPNQMLFLLNQLHRPTMHNVDHDFVLQFTSVGLSAQTPSPFYSMLCFL